jgi:hypothetical protein
MKGKKKVGYSVSCLSILKLFYLPYDLGCLCFHNSKAACHTCMKSSHMTVHVFNLEAKSVMQWPMRVDERIINIVRLAAYIIILHHELECH